MTVQGRSVFVPFLVLACSTLAAAQTPSNFFTTRFTVSGSFITSQPKEDFGRNVGNGYGANGTVMYHIVRSGLFSARLDVSGVEYDRETLHMPLSSSIGERILVDVNTSNWLATIGWAAELAAPSGRIRPYANVGRSHLFLRTTSSVSGIDSEDEDFASTTNYKDGTGAWVFGGGLRVPLSSRVPLNLDMGLRYYRGGMASYLREGSIIDNPDGSITITPLSSRTPFVVYTVGIQFRIPHNPTAACPRILC